MALRDMLPWRREEEDHPVVSLRREMDRLFEDFVRGFDIERFPSMGLASGRFNPKVDVAEDEREMEVTAELPGLTDDDIEVTLTENALTLKGEKKEEREEKDKNYHRIERSSGSFHRVIPLSAEVNRDKVTASFKKGVLRITLPKTKAAREKRKKIEVKL